MYIFNLSDIALHGVPVHQDIISANKETYSMDRTPGQQDMGHLAYDLINGPSEVTTHSDHHPDSTGALPHNK